MRAAAGDPFGEDTRAHLHARLSALGGDFTAGSGNRALLGLAVDAFGGLPAQRFERRPPRFNVLLKLSDHRKSWARGAAPPPPVFSSGADLLCATIDGGNFAVVDVAMSCVSKAMLQQPYYARYELIELAFVMLASRAQALVPLHAACVGINGEGVLLMGASGTGKSTLSLHALAAGMQLLSEDSAFVAPKSLRVTGVPNYLHLAPNALEFLPPGALRRAIERSPVIQRRSGVRKLRAETARKPLRLVATVFLSRRVAGRAPALEALARDAFLSRLRREQPYALRRSSDWGAFERRVAALPSYELRRTEHPDIAIRQLRELFFRMRRGP
jgi:hypothetical protein